MDDNLPKYLKNTAKLQTSLKNHSERFWVERGENMAVNLFREMSRRVPAYKDFLAKNNFDPSNVKSIQDFKGIPVIDKDNYLRQYKRADLCWDGKFAEKQWVVSTTSGSTGKPFYFPRTDLQDEYYALTAELYLRENFQIQDKKTLFIDAFAMGAWIGGLFTYEAIKRVADKGYALSIITPGINKAEVINSVRELGHDFDQVIIGCYPPIMRDIIDLGTEEGLDWADYNLGIIFSAEGFSEKFRDYIAEQAKLPNILTSTLNHYGTVDLGTMSHETPMSIFIRRQAIKDKELFKEVFSGVHKQPTFTQYMPEMFYFEEVDKNLLCSSFSGLPLVRYDLKDHGGVVSFRQIEKMYKKVGKDFVKEFAKSGIDKTRWNLPFVYVYERSDLSVTYLGAQIYPQEIRGVFFETDFHDKLTGKFTLEVTHNRKMESTLVINAELKKGMERNASISRLLKAEITKVLLEHNTEYASSYKSAGRKAQPKIILWPYEHALHFGGGGKQKWVKK